MRTSSNKCRQVRQTLIQDHTSAAVLQKISHLFRKILLFNALQRKRTNLLSHIALASQNRQHRIHILLIIFPFLLLFILIIPIPILIFILIVIVISEYNVADGAAGNDCVGEFCIVGMCNLGISEQDGLERVIIVLLYLSDNEAHLHLFCLPAFNLIEVDVCVLGRLRG